MNRSLSPTTPSVSQAPQDDQAGYHGDSFSRSAVSAVLIVLMVLAAVLLLARALGSPAWPAGERDQSNLRVLTQGGNKS